MVMSVQNDPNAGGVSPGGGKLTGEEIVQQATAKISKDTALLNAALNEPSSSTASHLAKLAVLNGKINDDITSLQHQLAAATDAGTNTTELSSQVRGLQRLYGEFQASFQAQDASYASSPEAHACNASAPVMSMPLANQKAYLTPQEKANLFLAPSLSTVLFKIMQTVQKQQMSNMDVNRQMKIALIASIWTQAKSSAALTLASGEAQANATEAQAAAQIASAFVSIAMGVLSFVNTIMISAKVDAELKASNDEIDRLDALNGTTTPKPSQFDISRLKQEKIMSSLSTPVSPYTAHENRYAGAVYNPVMRHAAAGYISGPAYVVSRY